MGAMHLAFACGRILLLGRYFTSTIWCGEQPPSPSPESPLAHSVLVPLAHSVLVPFDLSSFVTSRAVRSVPLPSLSSAIIDCSVVRFRSFVLLFICSVVRFRSFVLSVHASLVHSSFRSCSSHRGHETPKRKPQTAPCAKTWIKT